MERQIQFLVLRLRRWHICRRLQDLSSVRCCFVFFLNLILWDKPPSNKKKSFYLLTVLQSSWAPLHGCLPAVLRVLIWNQLRSCFFFFSPFSPCSLRTSLPFHMLSPSGVTCRGDRLFTWHLMIHNSAQVGAARIPEGLGTLAQRKLCYILLLKANHWLSSVSSWGDYRRMGIRGSKVEWGPPCSRLPQMPHSEWSRK